MAVAITALTVFFSGKPIWFVVVLSLAIGVFLVCIASLVFKSFALKVTESGRLKRLPRLVYDIHKRVCSVRNKLIEELLSNVVEIPSSIPFFSSLHLPAQAAFPTGEYRL